MRVIASKIIAKAMIKNKCCKVGLKLWLEVFNSPELLLEFNSGVNKFREIKAIWKNASGWNMDSIPKHRLRPRGRKGPLDIYVFDIHKYECRLIVHASSKPHTFFVYAVFSYAEYEAWCNALVV